jgi:hypothetical protein
LTHDPELRFDALWRDHAPAVVRYARRHVLPDEVDDVVAGGDRLTTVGGHAAVLGRPRGGEANGGPPGSTPTTPLFVEVAPGTRAFSWAAEQDLDDVERMLASLRQVAGDDPRLERYGTD